MRTFAILGDSISTFTGCNPAGYAVYYEGERAAATGVRAPEDTWWAQVAAHFGGRVVANGSYSGSMVAGAGFPAASSPERAQALVGADGAAPDTVLAFIGINDYGWGSPRAQAAARASATPPATDLASIPPGVAGVARSEDFAGFGRAYAAMLAQVRAACPAAEVWCCTLVPGRVAGSAAPTFAGNLRGVPFEAYNDAIRWAAGAAGCRLADTASYGRDYEALDGTHPTRRGMRQLAALTVAAMEGRPLTAQEARAEFDEPDAPAGIGAPADAPFASRACCDGGVCARCPWVQDASNTWRCVCGKPGR